MSTPDPNPLTTWQQCLAHLRGLYPEQHFQIWVEPLRLASLAQTPSGYALTIEAPNRFKQAWAKQNLQTPLEQWWLANLGSAVEIAVELPSEPSSGATGASATSGASDASDDSMDHLAAPTITNPAPEGDRSKTTERARLNPDWTFEHFVTGKANQMARAAARQVAEHPGTSYNPLFLYGGVGLGKSHLIHAVGNHILHTNPSAKIRYTHAESYVADVVRAFQTKSFDAFKATYHQLDLLLIDDIQFFSGKTRSQEEFFYAFEALIAAKKQIIITSDTYHSEIEGLSERLVTRFGSGLTVEIEPPELEMRVAILLRKADMEKFALHEEEAFFIARHLRSNVRELEGALRKVIAFCHFHSRVANLDTVREALRDTLNLTRTTTSVEEIQRVVANFYKIKIADMYSKRRPANIAMPRQIAMFLAKELTQKSYPEIGELFGGRDHTTVLHAVRKIGAERAKNAELNRSLHILEQQIRG